MRNILPVSLCLFIVSPLRADDVPEKYRPTVKKGLAWLVKQQHKDGHWSATGDQYSTAMTAFAGLALVAEGSTPRKGEHARSIRSAALWLIDQSNKETGLINGSGQSESVRYTFGHGYAMAFLATVADDLDAKDRKRARDVLNRAVQFTTGAQTKNGGWGYVTAKDGNDFAEGACTVCQIQGLHAARAAGIPVPREVLDRAYKYMKDATGNDGGVIYSLSTGGGGGQGRPPLTAAALAVGGAGDARSPFVKKWLLYCSKQIPLGGAGRFGFDEYSHYHYAQAVHTLGDQGWAALFPDAKEQERVTWSKYRETVFDNLMRTQAADGSWTSGNSGVGPVFATSLYLTVLQLDKGAHPVWRR